jgi:transposase-like protein
MPRWADNWASISPIFKYSPDVRKALYTTNAIESLNSQYRRINRARSVFPSEDALRKALYLASLKIEKKWTTKIHNWGQIYGELSVMFKGRL